MTLATVITIALSLFGLGQLLDFVVRRWQEDIWLHARITIWDRLEGIRPARIHRTVGEAICEWADLDAEHPPRGLLSGYALFICGWGYLWVSFLWLVATINPSRNFGGLLELAAARHVWVSMGMWALTGMLTYQVLFYYPGTEPISRFVKRLKDEGRRWFARAVDWSAAAVIWFFAGATLLLPIPWWIAAWNEEPFFREGLVGAINVFGDAGSIYITIQLLKLGLRGGDLWLALMSIVDLVVALLISFVTLGIASVAYGGPQVMAGRETLNAYLTVLALSNFIPTIILVGFFLLMSLLKFCQLTTKVVLKVAVNLVADPNRDTEAFPFSTIGLFVGILALLLFVIYVAVRGLPGL